MDAGAPALSKSSPWCTSIVPAFLACVCGHDVKNNDEHGRLLPRDGIPRRSICGDGGNHAVEIFFFKNFFKKIRLFFKKVIFF
jgi:hypothetical protein